MVAAFAIANGCQAKPLSASLTQTKGAWTVLADMPFAVQEIYPTKLQGANGDLIINAGGLTPWEKASFDVTDAVTIYDTRTGLWKFGKSLPEARHHIALATIGSSVFGISGFARDDLGGWRMQKNVWQIADIEQGEWQSRASLPVAQSEPVVLTQNGLIHIIGGRTPKGPLNLEWNDHTDTDRHWVYSPESDVWHEAAPLPMARNSAAGVVFEENLFVISGRTVSDGNSPRVDVYDLSEDKWRDIAPLPKATTQDAPHGQGGLAAAVWQGKIYVFGGEWFGNSGGVYSDIWEYDPLDEQWRSIGLMPRARHGLGALTLSDGIYLLGGASQAGGNETTAFLDRFIP